MKECWDSAHRRLCVLTFLLATKPNVYQHCQSGSYHRLCAHITATGLQDARNNLNESLQAAMAISNRCMKSGAGFLADVRQSYDVEFPIFSATASAAKTKKAGVSILPPQ